MSRQNIHIHGHRGARGLYPENTITAFLEAIKLGVDAIELDVVVSRDHQVVVSHEPWMNHLFCSTPNGNAIKETEEQHYNLYQMTYDEIAQYDCGIRGNILFPLQQKIKEHKPLLSQVIEVIEAFLHKHHLKPITYNIEIKTEINGYDYFHPQPEPFVKLVYDVLKKQHIVSRVILQSFDTRILEAINQLQASIPISYLVENKATLEDNLKLLNFKPDMYAPEFILINDAMLKTLHQKNIKLITWTVNEIEDMKRLVNMGVTTLITDYPDRAIHFLKHIH